MAVPKKRTSKRRKGMRRANDYLTFSERVTTCSNCGADVLLHHVCENCGYYKGKKVNFYTTFTRDDIVCKPNIDFEVVGRNFEQLNTYQNGRIKSYIGNFPTTRKGGSNITRITLAYLMAFNHICEYKKVGFVNNRPSKELVRELMYLTMPEVEGRNEHSRMYGITWSSVIKAWDLESDPNYDMYKKYFNSIVNTDLKNMNEVKTIKINEKVS